MDDFALPRSAYSVNDKLTILLARDKYVKSQRKRQTDIDKVKNVIGICKDMCPEYERYCRIDRKFVSELEKTDDQPDEYKMVKEYVRSGADQDEPLPYELRPPEILERTMLYLATNIIDLIEDESVDAGEYYDFLWNRLRAIKKDITQQLLKSESIVILLERCARFHIYSAHRFIEEDTKDFDPKMNNENLIKTMQSLKELYDDLNLHKNIQCPNEAEFRCYDILLNLCNGEALRGISKIKPSIRNTHQVKFALKVHQAFISNNFVKFFNLMRETTMLNACIMHRYFGLVRHAAFQLLSKAFTTGQKEELLPRDYLFDLLCFEQEDEFDDFCAKIGIQIDDNDNIVLRKEIEQINLNDYKIGRLIEYIDAKKGRKRLSELIYNEKIDENPYRKYPLENSFDENGQLIDSQIKLDDEIIKIDQKKVYSFSETKNKQSSEPITSTMGSSNNVNKFAFKDKQQQQDKSSAIDFGLSKTLFSQPPNLFGKPPVSFNQQSGNQNSLFGKKPTLFGNASTFGNQQPSTSSNLFTTSNNLFGKETPTSDNLFSKKSDQEPKPTTNVNSFQFKIPSKSIAQNVSQQSSLFNRQSNQTSNLFSDLKQQETAKQFMFKLPDQSAEINTASQQQQVEKQQSLQVVEEKSQLSDEELSSLNATIFQNILDEVLNDFISISIINVFINDYTYQFANLILNDLIPQLVNDLCTSVYTSELNKQQELKQIIGKVSSEICNKIFDEEFKQIVNSISKSVYLEELDTFILIKSKLIAHSYFEETFEELIYEICDRTLENETRNYQEIVNYIRVKRGWRLAKYYFDHWKKRCDRLKRYRFYRDNFPASVMEHSPPVLKRVLSVPEFDNSIEQSTQKRKFIQMINDENAVDNQSNDQYDIQLNLSNKFKNSTKSTSSSSLFIDLAKESQMQEELNELKEKFKKRQKNDELSTKSKLEYAKRALDNLKKVSLTFNKSLDFVRPILKSTDSKKL